MDPDAYAARIARRRDRSRHRVRWVSALVSKARLNPEYAIERIREWLCDPSLTLVLDSNPFEISARDADGDVAFAAEEFPETRCERWDGEKMVEYWGDSRPFLDYTWPLGPGTCAIPDGATPIILDEVFDRMELRDVATCARVCRLWRDCANASSKVANLVPVRHRGYLVRDRYRGKITLTIRTPDLRMATLFAPWEARIDDVIYVPNSLDLLGDALIAWFRARAPRALARAAIENPSAVRRGRPTICVEVPNLETGRVSRFRIFAREKSKKYVHLGINSLEIDDRRWSLAQFVAAISDSRLE